MKYHCPKTFEDAAQIAAGATGVIRYLAGGTDVLVQMRAGMVTPDDMIDLKHIPGVKKIVKNSDGSWTIGVAVAGAELGAHAGFCADYPGIVEGLELVGSTQVQGRATLTGNLCNGSPAADSVPAMIAAGAIAHVVGPNGARDIAVGDIPVGPGKTSLAKGELISAFTIPARAEQGGDAYLRFTPRTEMDIAVVGCAVNLTLEGDKIVAARIAMGAVAPTVILLPQASDAIVGTTLDTDALETLARIVSQAVKPISDKRGTAEFRTDVAGVLAKRAAKIAYDRAKGAK